MSKVGLRKLWLRVHKWIGVLMAILVIPLAATGSLLAWEERIDHSLRPSHFQRYGPAILPASLYVATARKALPPGSRIAALAIGRGPVLVTALAQQPDTAGPPLRWAAWVHPLSGKLIDRGPLTVPVLRWAHAFHGSLMIPGVGRAIVGWIGIALLLSALTGLWLWWPLQGSWRRGLRWRRRPALEDNLHHLVGFWAALPLAMLASTGILIAAPNMIGAAKSRKPMQMPLATPKLSVDRALEAASSPTQARVVWPTEEEPVWKVMAGRAAMVKVVDATGDLALGEDEEERRRPRPLYRRLHDGTGMGRIWRMVIALAGFAPTLLGVTGIIMWLRLRRRRDAEVAG